MSILITGGAGFLGRHFVHHLLNADGGRVVVLDTNDIVGLDERAEFVRGDVTNLSVLVDTVRRHGVTGIVHLAYVLESPDVRRQIEVDVTGTTNVFEAARRGDVPRVVFASSVLVYPHRRTLDGPRPSEDSPPAPDGVYGACKLVNEFAAQRYAEMYGLETVGLRFTAVFGPGRADRRDVAPDHNVLAELALRGRPVVMPPDDQLFDWMDVADAVEVIRLALRMPGRGHRVLNVASECRPAADITRAIRTLVPHADVTVAPDPVVTTSLMRTERLRRELPFTPAWGLEDALQRCFEAFRGAGA